MFSNFFSMNDKNQPDRICIFAVNKFARESIKVDVYQTGLVWLVGHVVTGDHTGANAKATEHSN